EYPLQITFGKIDDTVFLDPNLAEDLVVDGKITYAINNSDQICSIQKSGKAIWSQEEVVKYSKIAIEKANELRDKLNLPQYEVKI
ncbi:MAG: exosome complex component Rrp42, partial [Candidatus Lokiarchaeota archaeon]|nr:exosome complex component Rrp42 [Candidatus Lokiarchaeota archaeon]